MGPSLPQLFQVIDILYLAKGRPEFTEASYDALLRNTPNAAARLFVYTDGDLDNKWTLFESAFGVFCRCSVKSAEVGGPVAIMNDFLSQPGADIFAKIDNDVIVPPGWLERGLAVMEAHPELDLLGIEPPMSRTPAPGTRQVVHPENCIFGLGHSELGGYARCDSIGGIGLMRRRAFEGRPPMRPHGHNGVGGFTDWQLQNPDVVKGWIVPPLRIFLLDRLPFEPWASLSKKYIAEGIQRPWTNYSPDAHELWDWWKP